MLVVIKTKNKYSILNAEAFKMLLHIKKMLSITQGFSYC